MRGPTIACLVVLSLTWPGVTRAADDPKPRTGLTVWDTGRPSAAAHSVVVTEVALIR